MSRIGVISDLHIGAEDFRPDGFGEVLAAFRRARSAATRASASCSRTATRTSPHFWLFVRPAS